MSGPPLVERLAGHDDAVLAAVVASCATRGEPEHAGTTAELVRAVLRLVLGSESRSGALHDAGRRYAECGVSHAQAIHELHRTVIEMSRQWWASVAARDVAAMLLLSQAVDDGVERMRAELSDGYCAALAVSGTRSLGRRQLAETLLAGREIGAVLRRASDVEPAAHYLVLCISATARTGGLDAAASAVGPPGTLVRRAGDRIDVLVPVGRRALDVPGEATARYFPMLAAATGVTVAGAAVARRDALPAAAEDARVALEVATACGRLGAVLTGQVLVERAMTGSASAVRQLAELVASLGRWPHLPLTLAALYAHDLDRSRTAEHLHIARRTLTKRLDRVHQITGIHPTSAHGVQTFLSALAAHRLLGRTAVEPGRTG